MGNTLNIENGKHINELDDVKELLPTDKLLITSNGLTFNVSLSNLRKSFISDGSANDKNETFYTSKDIDDQFNQLRELISRGYSDEATEINNRITVLQTNISEELKDLKDSIKYIKDYLKI